MLKGKKFDAFTLLRVKPTYQPSHVVDDFRMLCTVAEHLAIMAIKTHFSLWRHEKFYLLFHKLSFITVCTTKRSLGLNLVLPVNFC